MKRPNFAGVFTIAAKSAKRYPLGERWLASLRKAAQAAEPAEVEFGSPHAGNASRFGFPLCAGRFGGGERLVRKVLTLVGNGVETNLPWLILKRMVRLALKTRGGRSPECLFKAVAAYSN